jgi:hypothetical protein
MGQAVEFKETWTPLIAQFKSEVADRASQVDQYDEHDWRSLTVGWAVAKGLPPEEANDFALYVRYETDLG